MATTPVIFVLHNHQPVGNLPWVVEDCFRTAYLPFLKALERHPGMRLGLHFTGPLLDWLAEHQPEYLARVRALRDAGQVEVLGGAYYEPILTAIPEADRLGQMVETRHAVTELFGQAPTGAWLAERVWDPTLPRVLTAAGIAYTLLDDEAWLRLDYAEPATRALYITEDQGATIRLLPISHRLRYTLPTRPVDEVIATLRAMAAEGAGALIYAEDGERYGNWPGTFGYLYGDEAYVDRLFTALEQADDLSMTLPREYAGGAPRGRVYLPPTSYAEMLRWSGGFWQHFLTRYPESNLMHKKMLQVSGWVAALAAAGRDMPEARRDLYAAQCNCAYWHGTFGGLYLPHLRRAVYHHLLRAERRIASYLPASVRGACDVIDGDCDGQPEVYLRGGALGVGIAPARGGTVFAIEHYAIAHNYLATLARHPLREQEREGMSDLPVDWHPRVAFLDHIVSRDCTPEMMRDMQYEELGDFTVGVYQFEMADAGTVRLWRDGHLRHAGQAVPLRIVKSYTLDGPLLRVAYMVENRGDVPCDAMLAVETNIVLSGSDLPTRALTLDAAMSSGAIAMTQTGASEAVHGVVARDTWLGGQLHLTWDRPTECWVFPIACPLRSIDGFEWVYQSTAVIPRWRIALAPAERFSVTWEVAVAGAETPAVSMATVGNAMSTDRVTDRHK